MRYEEIHSEEFEVVPAVDPSDPADDATPDVPPKKPDVVPQVVSFTPKAVTLRVDPFVPSAVVAPAEIRVVALPSGTPDMSPGEAIGGGFPQEVLPLTLSQYGGTIAAKVPDVEAGKYIGKVYAGYPEA